MHALSYLVVRCSTALLVLSFLAARVSASYFVITEPSSKTQWVNNQAHLVQWDKGVLDDINGFDVEMARLTKDGLSLVAMNVPAKQKKLNLYIQDVPPGDDYFLIFINSTHGVMHATSSRFTILASTDTPTSPPSVTAAPTVPTVTVKGGPNPTQMFATTFPAIPSTAFRRWGVEREVLVGVVGACVGMLLGGYTAMW